jgi:hypothetical protein
MSVTVAFRILSFDISGSWHSRSLKGLSREIERGCWWYGCLDLYVERCWRRFIIFIGSLSIYYSNKNPVSGAAKC